MSGLARLDSTKIGTLVVGGWPGFLLGPTSLSRGSHLIVEFEILLEIDLDDDWFENLGDYE